MIDTAAIQKRITPANARPMWLKAIIYGKSGVGKTVLLATKKAGKRTLIVDVEDGTLSIAGADVDVVRITFGEDPDSQADAFAQMQAIFTMLKADAGKKYDLLAIDSLTQAQKFVLSGTIREKIKQREAKSLWKASLEDQGIMTEKMRHMLWDLRSLPMHIVYTCLSQDVLPEGEVQTYETLALTPKFRDNVLAYSDVVARLDITKARDKSGNVVENVRRLSLQSDGSFAAKVRTPLGKTVPAYILQPTLDKLISAFRGEEETK